MNARQAPGTGAARSTPCRPRSSRKSALKSGRNLLPNTGMFRMGGNTMLNKVSALSRSPAHSFDLLDSPTLRRGCRGERIAKETSRNPKGARSPCTDTTDRILEAVACFEMEGSKHPRADSDLDLAKGSNRASLVSSTSRTLHGFRLCVPSAWDERLLGPAEGGGRASSHLPSKPELRDASQRSVHAGRFVSGSKARANIGGACT